MKCSRCTICPFQQNSFTNATGHILTLNLWEKIMMKKICQNQNNKWTFEKMIHLSFALENTFECRQIFNAKNRPKIRTRFFLGLLYIQCMWDRYWNGVRFCLSSIIAYTIYTSIFCTGWPDQDNHFKNEVTQCVKHICKCNVATQLQWF